MRDFQYQLEKIFDWVVYLKYLQAVLREFDPITALNKNIFNLILPKRPETFYLGTIGCQKPRTRLLKQGN